MTETSLRRYPLATIEVLENAGHHSMNETPLAPVIAVEACLCEIAPVEHDHVTAVSCSLNV